jgi:hypothetical protein
MRSRHFTLAPKLQLGSAAVFEAPASRYSRWGERVLRGSGAVTRGGNCAKQSFGDKSVSKLELGSEEELRSEGESPSLGCERGKLRHDEKTLCLAGGAVEGSRRLQPPEGIPSGIRPRPGRQNGVRKFPAPAPGRHACWRRAPVVPASLHHRLPSMEPPAPQGCCKESFPIVPKFHFAAVASAQAAIPLRPGQTPLHAKYNFTRHDKN